MQCSETLGCNSDNSSREFAARRPSIQTAVLEFSTMFNQRRAIATLRSGERRSQPGALEAAGYCGKFIAASLITAFAAFLLPSTMLAQSGPYTQTNILSDGWCRAEDRS